MSSKSSSKSFIARCGRDAEGGEQHTKKKAPRFIAHRLYTYRFFPRNRFQFSLSLIKKRDHLAKKKEDKKTLRERRIERRNKLSSSLFRTVTTCPSLSCMSLTGTPTPFPLRPTLLVLMTTDRPTHSFLITIKKRRTGVKKLTRSIEGGGFFFVLFRVCKFRVCISLLGFR